MRLYTDCIHTNGTHGPYKARNWLPLLVFAISLTAAEPASTMELSGIRPFQPALTVGQGNPVCERFAEAWQAVYSSPSALGVGSLDLEKAFPSAKLHLFPREPSARGSYGGIYEQVYTESLDLNDDQENEIIHVEGWSIGWRYMGVRIYRFDSEVHYATAFEEYKSKVVTPYQKALNLWRLREPLSAASELIGQLGPVDRVAIIKLENRLYAVNTSFSPPRRGSGSFAESYLLQLDNSTEEAVLCTVDMLTPLSLDDVVTSSPFYQSLKPIYGGGTGCMGTLGWTAAPIQSPLSVALHRPWTLRPDSKTDPDKQHFRDLAIELRYLSWGLTDPTSWQVYLDWKAARHEFRAALAEYYRKHFVDTDEQAKTWAETAVQAINESIIYNHYYDNFHLTALTNQVAPHVQDATTISPTELIAALIDAQPEWHYPKIGQELVLAALYTGQPPTTVSQLIDNALEREKEQLVAAKDERQTNRLIQEQKKYVSQLLLASLSDPVSVSSILELGADVNASTNEFGKTALMYAAQNSFLDAVSLLLAKGADPDMATLGKPCYRLKRDNRTALMYAAENASRELIMLLVEADADIAAKDSKGNGVLWYLERNAGLKAEEKAELERLLSIP